MSKEDFIDTLFVFCYDKENMEVRGMERTEVSTASVCARPDLYHDLRVLV